MNEMPYLSDSELRRRELINLALGFLFVAFGFWRLNTDPSGWDWAWIALDAFLAVSRLWRREDARQERLSRRPVR